MLTEIKHMTSWENASDGKVGGGTREERWLKLNLPASTWIDGEVVPMLSSTEENQENFAEVVSIMLVKKFLETSVAQQGSEADKWNTDSRGQIRGWQKENKEE